MSLEKTTVTKIPTKEYFNCNRCKDSVLNTYTHLIDGVDNASNMYI